ncbi:MAG: DegT/DnrJ/EryC1/StrS family aminotransferase [Candidatus Bathyarchaeia archaeon]
MEKLAIHGGEPVSKRMIPIAKPVFSEKTIKDVSDILKSGFIRQGPRTREFEERFSEKTGAKYACAVSTGTAALHIAYLSTINPGDEIIVPSFTFFATASMVLHSKGRPVFADIDPETFLIDPEDVLEKITDETKAIVPVHLFGNAANMNALNELAEDHHLVIISDSAQAHGTVYEGRDIGSYDALNCYSFYPTKSMTTGEGGMITTNDERLWELAKLLRNHGDDGRYHHVALGLNYRMTEISAVIGLNQLEELDENLAKRRRVGKILRGSIEKIEGLTPQRVEDKVNHSYSYFSLTMDLSQFRCTRNQFIEALKAENIDCAVHYPLPLSKQPAITAIMNPSECPISEDVSRRIFSIPMHPELSDEDLRLIIRGIEKVASHYHV